MLLFFWYIRYRLLHILSLNIQGYSDILLDFKMLVKFNYVALVDKL